MANDLRLQVIMDLANKASAPLRNISASSSEAAKALKAARDQLKQLESTQSKVSQFSELKKRLDGTSNQLKEAREHMRSLANAMPKIGPPTQAMSQEFEAARKKASQLSYQLGKQKLQAEQLRASLRESGISTRNLAQHQIDLNASIKSATAAIEQQRAKLKQLADQQKQLNDLKAQHGKDMMKVGMAAGAGVGMQAAGRGMAKPVLSSLGAFAQQESATSQLTSAMMLANGSVESEFKQIYDLALRLGDRLPGTTADFIEMMTMLRRQGVQAKTILGGTGEAAAYLGVQMKMPAVAAAEFAAKMQDATRTTEADMMGLMDMIQRTYYLGVDSNNMMQGFSNISPVMRLIKQEGLAAANTLAPLLVMMDQTKMAGESAGNAIRKVFAAGLNLKKMEKGNKILQQAHAGFKLNFVNKDGNFAGLENFFEQLKKLKTVKSDTTKVSVIHAMFGDDAENMKVLETMMDKGLAGYQEVADKMKAQADLRKRVDGELKTLANLWEAATGSFTNVLASIGKTIEPQAKALVDWLGEIAGKARVWIEENPRLVGSITMAVGVISAMSFALGTLTLSLAAILGPMLLARFMFARLALGYAAMGGASGLAAAGLFKIKGLLALVVRLGTALFRANPIAAAAFAISAAFYDLYLRWDQLKALFNAGEWMKLGASIWEGIEYGLNAATMGMYGLVKGILSGLIDLALGIFDINSPSKVFAWIGGMLMDGLISGITSRLGALKDTVVGAASAIGNWFNEKLGGGAALVRTASAGLAAATAIGAPGMAGAAPLRIDQRPPLTSAAARPMATAGSSPTNITIHAAPGMDPQAVARAVSAELDRRDRAQAARRRSTLGDIS